MTVTLQLSMRLLALFTVICAVPTALAVTVPSDETVATEVLLEVHVTDGDTSCDDVVPEG